MCDINHNTLPNNMFSIGEINKQNNQTARDEENRLKANFDVQDNGDVWVRYEGRLKILEAGPEADKFLADVKGFPADQLKVYLAKNLYA